MNYTSIYRQISRYLGLSIDSADQTSDEQVMVDDIIKAGLISFYGAYNWSFLKPHASITLKAPFTADIQSSPVAGTYYAMVSVYVSSVDETTLTFTGGTWDTDEWVDWYILDATETYYWKIISNTATVLTVETGDRELTDLVSATETVYITPKWTTDELVGRDVNIASGTKDWAITANTHGSFTISANADSICDYGTEFTIQAEYKQDLPSDFSELHTDLIIRGWYTHLMEVPFNDMLQFRQNSVISTPYYASIVPKSTDGTTEQRYEIWVYPTPSDDFILDFRYRVNPHEIDSTDTEPYGGTEYGDAILYSCLAEAELSLEYKIGDLNRAYQQKLGTAIQRDGRKKPMIIKKYTEIPEKHSDYVSFSTINGTRVT